jgi:hypothetical protein
MEQLDFHWTDYCETWHLSIFRKSVQKIQDLVTSDRNNGTLNEELVLFMEILR